MRPGDTAKFNTVKYNSTVDDMKKRGEAVHDKGREIYARTGNLDPLIDITGKNRVARNAMSSEGDKAVLTLGITLPIWTGFDGTGSMAENSSRAHAAQGNIHAMLNAIRKRYNPQLSASVIQDVSDTHSPFQMTQFEGDERIAEQLRLLIPDGAGGDAIEDYQLSLAYLMLATDTDIVNFYGLKGYGFIVGDQIGRENVTKEEVKAYLGHTLQNTMTTKAVVELLLPKWHMYYIHVGSGGRGGSEDFATEWWKDKFGVGHVVIAHDPNLIAEVQCALIYVTETEQPTEEGLHDFLTDNGSNKSITKDNSKKIWSWIVETGVEFGAQTKFPGYGDIPMPGDVFEHYRHQWPIDHPLFSKNVIPAEKDNLSSGKATSGAMSWDKF